MHLAELEHGAAIAGEVSELARPAKHGVTSNATGARISRLLSSLLLLAFIGWAFLTVRRESRQSAAARRRFLLGGLAATAGALIVIFVLPRFIPETPGSPGTIVGVALLWVLGSVILFAAIPTFLGALFARPRQEP